MLMAKIINEDIRKKTKITDITHVISKLGHGLLSRIVLNCRPRFSKRRVGRLLTHWTNDPGKAACRRWINGVNLGSCSSVIDGDESIGEIYIEFSQYLVRHKRDNSFRHIGNLKIFILKIKSFS